MSNITVHGRSHLSTSGAIALSVLAAGHVQWPEPEKPIFHFAQRSHSFSPITYSLLSASRPSVFWQEIEYDIDRWSALAADWDGEGAVAPTEDEIAAARATAGKLFAAGIPKPDHFIDGDGEISFDWQSGPKSASLSFLPNGHIAGYYSDGEHPLTRIDGEPVGNVDWTSFLPALAKAFA